MKVSSFLFSNFYLWFHNFQLEKFSIILRNLTVSALLLWNSLHFPLFLCSNSFNYWLNLKNNSTKIFKLLWRVRNVSKNELLCNSCSFSLFNEHNNESKPYLFWNLGWKLSSLLKTNFLFSPFAIPVTLTEKERQIRSQYQPKHHSYKGRKRWPNFY